MKAVIQEKENATKILADELSKAKSIIIFEYLGLNARELTALRHKLYASRVKLYIVKNNILNRALSLTKISDFNYLQGPNALLLAYGDGIVPFKELYEIIKTHQFVIYKDGILDKQHVKSTQLVQIASIPERNVLLSMLLSCLQGSIRNLVYGIKSVGEHKTQ